MTPGKLHITRSAGMVEFRQRTSAGIRVVKVFTATPTPRIIAYTEDFSRGLSISPMSLFLDEIVDYISEALKAEGRSNAEIRKAIEVIVNDHLS